MAVHWEFISPLQSRKAAAVPSGIFSTRSMRIAAAARSQTEGTVLLQCVSVLSASGNGIFSSLMTQVSILNQ